MKTYILAPVLVIIASCISLASLLAGDDEPPCDAVYSVITGHRLILMTVVHRTCYVISNDSLSFSNVLEAVRRISTKATVGLESCYNTSQVTHFKLVESLNVETAGILGHRMDNGQKVTPAPKDSRHCLSLTIECVTALHTLVITGNSYLSEPMAHGILESNKCILDDKFKTFHILSLMCRDGDSYISTGQIVDLLQNYNLSQVDVNGLTLVRHASNCDQIYTVTILETHGADMSERDKKKRNLMHTAALNGAFLVVKYLSSTLLRGYRRVFRMNIDSQDVTGTTALMAAAMGDHVEVVKLLVGEHCSIDLENNIGNNVLHVAARQGSLRVVEFLLDLGMSVNKPGGSGATAAMFAAYSGNVHVVRALVQAGCDLSATDAKHSNIFHLAVRGGSTETVAYLLSLGINIDCPGVALKTGLIIAASLNDVNMVTFLVENGCNTTLTDRFHRNALHLAAIKGHLKVVQYLISERVVNIDGRGFSNQTAIMMSALKGRTSVVDYLYKHGCDVTLKDTQGYSLMDSAVISGQLDVVRNIISNGLDIDTPGFRGLTPAMLALSRRQVNVCEYLIKSGCDLAAVDGKGQRLIHIAVVMGSVRIAELILSAQSRDAVLVKNNLKFTPVQLAIVLGKLRIVKIFFDYYGCTISRSWLAGIETVTEKRLVMFLRKRCPL